MYRSGDIFFCIFMRFSEHETLQFPCMVTMGPQAHYRRHPSVFKLIQLLSVHNKKELKIILEN
jgi:hypothetical protein